jgi:hypothetical protein
MELPRREFLQLAAATAGLSPVAALAQGTGAIKIVERTQYYAKPGLAAPYPAIHHLGNPGLGLPKECRRLQAFR